MAAAAAEDLDLGGGWDSCLTLLRCVLLRSNICCRSQVRSLTFRERVGAESFFAALSLKVRSML